MKFTKMRLSLGLLLILVICDQLNAGFVGRKQKYRNNHHHHHSSGNKRSFNRKCGYDGCPQSKPDMLNVHIVPHTHDDVGWLKTVDQYYYGNKIEYQKASVQYILDSVIEELLEDPNKRFIYVESAFFFKWWNHQTDSLKTKVKELVDQGRLEFIGGAWSMNDEATTHYQSTIDQFTWGLRRLNDTFGECGRPKIGWQIDPFGHARELASLLAQMSYDGLFLGRIDYQDKAHRMTNREAEMIWHASDSLGEKANLFTGVLFNTYSPPPGFCFDILCSDDPIIDDKDSPEYNVDRKVNDFFKYVRLLKDNYRSNNVLITMGDDFNYQDALAWFKNLDLLIKHANERQVSGSKINLFYSTPSCYLKSLYDSNITWPTKSDDFFPYASDPHSFWTGYFTSRPTLKYFERIGNGILQVCKQLTALSPKKRSNFEENLTAMREVMGIFQHHDAISGTEKQHVANDYAHLLQRGINKCSENIQESLNQLTVDTTNNQMKSEEKSNSENRFEFELCPELNISSCSISENSEKFMVTLYNPLAHSTFQYVRIPVTDGDYEVMDYRNVSVHFQIVSIPEQIQSLFYRRSSALSEIVFMANELPPLGYKSYFIERKSKSEEEMLKMLRKTEPEVVLMQSDGPMADEPVKVDNENGPFKIGNRFIELSFDENGLLNSVKSDDTEMTVRQNFYLYHGFDGDNREFAKRASGAYIFRPNDTEAKKIVSRADVKVIRGDIVQEVHQTFNDWISQVIRIYKDDNFVEFQWLIGGIPVDDKVGKEIITRFETDIESSGVFYTDSNGREMLKRMRDHRDTWNVRLFEKMSGNYYPITTKIAIEDENKRFAILTDRAQGGSSLADGSIEIMLHRRLLKDDAFGVGEPLNETAYGKGLIARGTSYIVFGSKNNDKNPSLQAVERFIQLQKLLPSVLLFSDLSDYSYDTWRSSFTNIYSGLSLSLPQNIHLMTFEPWKPGTILVRFEHILAKNEDKQYSQNVTFNLNDVFRSLNMIDIRETTLSANQWLNEASRFKFNSRSEDSNQIQTTNESATESLENSTSKKVRRSYNPKPDVSTHQYYNSKRQYKRYRQEESGGDKYVVTLKPMEIRTFVIALENKL